ncbi:27647_t:CDS:2 [Dentiscutata erythropus]|uniref:27647_t:CDS:1 n=1 Tax=Dentiscutata erythropus TaxID=1348616 RepID=A0A9N9EWM7_9GLOM|nr:27647_t:CDS:2 [Dentiscutata erythropus]
MKHPSHLATFHLQHLKKPSKIMNNSPLGKRFANESLRPR